MPATSPTSAVAAVTPPKARAGKTPVATANDIAASVSTTAPVDSAALTAARKRNALSLARQLQNAEPEDREPAVLSLRQLAKEQPHDLASELPDCLESLLHAGLQDDVLELSRVAILAAPHAMPAVSKDQRARVLALLAQHNDEQALMEAKCNYNLSILKDTDEAINLIAEALNRTRGGNDPQIGKRLKEQQLAKFASASTQTISTGTIESGILSSIKIDPNRYSAAIDKTRKGSPTFGKVFGRGNLLLLEDRPGEAQAAFLDACTIASTAKASHDLRIAIEGVARAIRAERQQALAANQFLDQIASGNSPSSLPPALQKLDKARLRSVVGQIARATLAPASQPELEFQRAATADAETSDPAINVSLELGFECAGAISTVNLSPTHLQLALTSPELHDWFMFRLHHVAGRTVRLDFSAPNTRIDKWWTLNPVYTYAKDLSDPEVYRTATSSLSRISDAPAGLPDTQGQQWHYVSGAWMSDPKTFSLVQQFEQDDVCIAMRVPRPPAYAARWNQRLVGMPDVKVLPLGSSLENRQLSVIQIGKDADAARKPCAVIYAAEHGDEPDGAWVAEGLVDYLLSDAPAAAEIRSRVTFLVIPMLDPDCTAAGAHERVIGQFLPMFKKGEAISYANWFESWVESGNRLDLVVNCHNVQSSESPHCACAEMEALDPRRATASMAFHTAFLAGLRSQGYSVRKDPVARGWSPDRLAGWLSRFFGPVALHYEFNAQAPGRHLSLAELRAMGVVLAGSIDRFFAGGDGKALLASIDERRRERLAQLSMYTGKDANENALLLEANRAGVTDRITQTPERWIP